MPTNRRGLAPMWSPAAEGGPAAETPVTRILIIEDDYFVASNLEHRLKEAGYEVVGIAVSAREAEQLAREHRPALAITDIRLAGNSDGIEAAITLSNVYGVPSIFASAHGDAETRRRAEGAHPLGWVSKPYSFDLVLAAIRSALDRS